MSSKGHPGTEAITPSLQCKAASPCVDDRTPRRDVCRAGSCSHRHDRPGISQPDNQPGRHAPTSHHRVEGSGPVLMVRRGGRASAAQLRASCVRPQHPGLVSWAARAREIAVTVGLVVEGHGHIARRTDPAMVAAIFEGFITTGTATTGTSPSVPLGCHGRWTQPRSSTTPLRPRRHDAHSWSELTQASKPTPINNSAATTIMASSVRDRRPGTRKASALLARFAVRSRTRCGDDVGGVSDRSWSARRCRSTTGIRESSRAHIAGETPALAVSPRFGP